MSEHVGCTHLTEGVADDARGGMQVIGDSGAVDKPGAKPQLMSEKAARTFEDGLSPKQDFLFGHRLAGVNECEILPEPARSREYQDSL